MRRVVRAPVDLAAGLLILAIGAVALWVGRDWRAGTLAEMDTGWFPRALASALVAGGLALAGRALALPGEAMPGLGLRPLVAVTAGVVGFALAIDRLGLAVAILVVVACGSFAGARLRPLPFVVLWAALTAMCAAIFVWGVALPIRVWPSFRIWPF